jgi:hypothetical protein
MLLSEKMVMSIEPLSLVRVEYCSIQLLLIPVSKVLVSTRRKVECVHKKPDQKNFRTVCL